MSTARGVGRAISVMGHPFVVLPVAIALSTERASLSERAVVLGIVAGCLLVLAAFVVLEYKRGAVADVDFSAREKRPRLYAVALIATGAACLVLHFGGQPPAAVRGTAIACGLLAIGFALNRWLKVSLHTAFAVYAVGLLWSMGPAAIAASLAVAFAVAWARVACDRHTRREVLVGLALGAGAACAHVLL